MLCKACGQEIIKEQKDRWCMYQVQDGKVVDQLFHPDVIPDGWYESPALAKASVTDVPEPKRRGRPPKVTHDNSAGFDQHIS